MAESSVIREFLVALGFKVDKTGQESFVSAVENTTVKVMRLAASVEGMAGTVAYGVARFASNLEQLYFAAQRTGSSATSLKAFQRTAQDFGASAGEALGSVEGLSQSMRMNPGNVALLESLGVHLKRTKDGTYDATDALMQFGDAMRKKGYFKHGHFYMAEEYARMFGINERTLLALRNGNFDKEYASIHKRIAGHGFTKATADAHRFMDSLRDLQTSIEVFGAQVEDAIQKKLGVNLKHLNAWLEKHGPTMAAQLVTAALELLHVAEWIGRKIEWLIPKFERINEDTDGWAGKLIALYTVLRLIGGMQVIGAIFRLVGAFRGVGVAMATASAEGEGIAAVLSTIVGFLGAIAVGVGAGYLFDKLFPHNLLAEGGGKMGDLLEGFTHRKQRAMQYFMSQGWTPWQAAGMVANLQAESGLLSGAVGDHGRAEGLAQWHKPRQEEFERVMGRPLKGSSFMQQLEFINYEARHDPEYGGKLLADSRTASAAARIFSEHFERPADGAQQAAIRAADATRIMDKMRRTDPILTQVQRRWHPAGERGPALAASQAPTINQKTEINIHGVSHPVDAAHEVSAEQRHVNASLARNFTSAVQ